MANWQKDLGSAETGAGYGASIGSIIPGVGTAIGGAIGGGLGLLSGLFSGDDEKPQIPNDPNRGREDALINQLSSDKMSDTAVNASARARRSFLDTMDSFKNIPGVGRNAAVQAKLGVDANDALGNNLVDINTADAKQRLQNKTEAANIMESQRNFDFQRNSSNIALQQKPSFLETLGQLGASKLAGGAVGLLNNNMGKDSAPEDSANPDGESSTDGGTNVLNKLMNSTPQPKFDYTPTRMNLFDNFNAGQGAATTSEAPPQSGFDPYSMIDNKLNSREGTDRWARVNSILGARTNY